MVTIKLLRGKHRQKPFDINCSKIFFDPPPTVIKIKTKINKEDLTTLESFWIWRSPSLAYIWRKLSFKKINAPQCSLQHYVQ